MDPLLQQFYDFLKEKYGVQNSERFNTHKTIHCEVGIEIPGFAKNNPNHSWTIHLETDSEDNREGRLILGAHWPEENRMWGRYLQIEKQPHSSLLFFKLIETVHFKKDHSLKNLIAFMKAWEEFFESSPVEA